MCSSPDRPEPTPPPPVTAPPPPATLETGAAEVVNNKKRGQGLKALRIDKSAPTAGGSGLNIPT